MENKKLETLDIIIPTKNSERTIKDCLTSVVNQTVPCRVILVDGHSTDKTMEIAKEFNVEVYFEPDSPNKRKSAEARNEGLKHSNSRLVGFIDADAVLPQTWAEDLAKYFANSVGVAGVSSGCVWRGKREGLGFVFMP